MVPIKEIPYPLFGIAGWATHLAAPEVMKGVEEATGEVAAGFTTPGSVMTLPLAAESKPMQAYMAMQSAAAIPGTIEAITKAESPQDVTKATVHAGANLAMLGLMGKGFAERPSTIPIEKGVPDAIQQKGEQVLPGVRARIPTESAGGEVPTEGGG